MALITYPLNGIEYSAENAETYLCTRTSGVFSAENNFQARVTNDRQVTISKGLAWIKNSDSAGKSVYNESDVAIEIPIADGTRPRIDRIVLKFDKAANSSSIILKQGEPSSAPVAPTVEKTELVYELGLCTVYVAAGSTIVTNKDLTSTLTDESICGLMRDGVTGIPTQQLQEQVEELIQDLKRAIIDASTGEGIMTTAVYDPQGFSRDIFAEFDNYYTKTEADTKFGLQNAITIPEKSDLNDAAYWKEGEYCCEYYTTSIANAPVVGAFHLRVFKFAGNFYIQEYTVYDSGDVYRRIGNTTSQEPWKLFSGTAKPITPENGWGTSSTFKPTVSKSGRIVCLTGAIISGTTSVGTTVLTLPERYRPAKRELVPVYNKANGSVCFAVIETSGLMQITSGGNWDNGEKVINVTFIGV